MVTYSFFVIVYSIFSFLFLKLGMQIKKQTGNVISEAILFDVKNLKMWLYFCKTDWNVTLLQKTTDNKKSSLGLC